MGFYRLQMCRYFNRKHNVVTDGIMTLRASNQASGVCHWIKATSYRPGHAKTCLMPYANNKDADQPAHPRSLISTFVIRCLDSMTCILAIAISKISRFYLASVAEQDGLNLTWSKIPDDMFSRGVAHIIMFLWRNTENYPLLSPNTLDPIFGPSQIPIWAAVRPVSSKSSLSAWRKLGSLATHWVHSEDSDQTGRMHTLFVGFVMLRLILSVSPIDMYLYKSFHRC